MYQSSQFELIRSRDRKSCCGKGVSEDHQRSDFELACFYFLHDGVATSKYLNVLCTLYLHDINTLVLTKSPTFVGHFA